MVVFLEYVLVISWRIWEYKDYQTKICAVIFGYCAYLRTLHLSIRCFASFTNMYDFVLELWMDRWLLRITKIRAQTSWIWALVLTERRYISVIFTSWSYYGDKRSGKLCYNYTVLFAIQMSKQLVCLVRNLLKLWYFDVIGRKTSCLERRQKSWASAC